MDLLGAIVSAVLVSSAPIDEAELDLSYRECRFMWDAAKRSGDADVMRNVAHLCRRINPPNRADQ